MIGPEVTAATADGHPEFLGDYAPSRGLERLTPLSRRPATAFYANAWHVAAERNAGQRIVLDRPPDIAPTSGSEWTYATWAGLVEEAAAWLHAAGVGPWDRVALIKSNHLDVTVLGAAAARLGAIPAQLAWDHPPKVVQLLLERLERPVLVIDRERLEQSDLAERELETLTARTICIDDPGGKSDVIPLNDLRGAPPAPARPRALDEPMVITHTSGTTGPPKLVMHSARTIHALSHVETERYPYLGLSANDTLGFCDPYFHQRMQTGLLALATATPELVALSDPGHANVRRVLARHVPTVVETLPNIYLMWEPLARDPARLFRNVRLYVNSFDAIHTRTIRTFLNASERRLPVWVQSWSQTENGALVIRPYTRRLVRRRGKRPPVTQKLGWPLPGIAKVRAVNPDTGRPVARGQVGLIEISQPGRCLGYVGEQDRHRLKRDHDWWNTGDLGVISGLGSVRLVDREVDRIPGASGIELEDVLLDRLPRTSEVVILAVPDALPVPILATEDGVPVPEEDWQCAVNDLPPLADPIHLAWGEIPRTATWKVKRNDLRERVLGQRPVGSGRWS